MSGTATYAPVVRREFGGGEEWTEEQKANYQAQWDNFARLMAKRQEGQTRDFDATIMEIGEPHEVANNFPGAKSAVRTVRTIRVQLAQQGVDMLRFQGDSADNPFNDKTLLHKTIVAAAGFTPQQEEGLSINFADLVGKKVRVTIEKQRQRTDGKRGGFWSKLRDIQPLFDDEDDGFPTSAAPSPGASATNPVGAQSAANKAPWE